MDGKEYIVEQGDCFDSIAADHGFFWETIWNDTSNASLKQTRKDPYVLLPGDIVHVPSLREKEESGGTESRHRFKRKGVPSMLRIILKKKNKPRANESYILEIDGKSMSGKTDQNGKIEHRIPPNARRGKLVIGEDQQEHLLLLGGIDPISEVTGVQARLQNLGFFSGRIDGVLGPRTMSAVRRFQEEYGLSTTGTSDAATKEKLKEVYGC